MMKNKISVFSKLSFINFRSHIPIFTVLVILLLFVLNRESIVISWNINRLALRINLSDKNYFLLSNYRVSQEFLETEEDERIDPRIALVLAKFARTNEDIPKSNEYLMELLSVDPDNQVANYLMAENLISQGNWEAIKYIDKLKILKASEIFASPSQFAIWYALWGNELFKNGDLSGCVSKYEKSLDYLDSPISATSYLGSARCLYKIGAWGEAIDMFQKALLVSDYIDDDTQTLYLRAWIGYYSSIIQNVSNDSEIRYRYSRLLELDGQIQRSLQEYEELFNLDNSLSLLANREKAWVYFKLGEKYVSKDRVLSNSYFENALINDPKLANNFREILSNFQLGEQTPPYVGVKKQLDIIKPTIELNEVINEKWELVGIDPPEEWLVQTVMQFPVTFYWKKLNENNSQVYSVETRIVTNLIPNGGFEWSDEALELGYIPFPQKDLSQIHVEKLFANDLNSAVLNIEGSDNAVIGLRSNSKKKLINGSYLMSIKIFTGRKENTPGSGARVQVGWINSEMPNNEKFSYLLEGKTIDTWTSYFRVMQPLEYSSYYNLYINSWFHEGELFFDTLYFINIPIPSS